jgi:DNA-binding LacI/PurR family transcriptional regulator
VAENTKDMYPHNVPFLKKLAGYKRAIKEAKITFDPDMIVAAPSDYMGGEQCLEQLLDRSPLPTAVFCTGDVLALGVLRGARKRGLNIPADLAVIGFDNVPVSGYWNPTLSTVSVPLQKMAEEAFRRLSRLMKGEDVAPSKAIFETELVIRESCP